MLRQFKPQPAKTYATEANAIAAVTKKFDNTNLLYMVVNTPEGRFYPVFIGKEALQFGVHFHGFMVVG